MAKRDRLPPPLNVFNEAHAVIDDDQVANTTKTIRHDCQRGEQVLERILSSQCPH
jgi:hypothetical protein